MPLTLDPPLFLCPHCGRHADEFPGILFVTVLAIYKHNLQGQQGDEAKIHAFLTAKGEQAGRSLIAFYDANREAIHARLTA